jgi:hypothetical protein
MSKTEDIAMKYNINLIRGCMRLTTIVIATVALASSAFGELFETPSQFEPRRADRVETLPNGIVVMDWIGKSGLTHVGFFDGNYCVTEVFGYANDQMSKEQMITFLTPYSKRGFSLTEASYDGVKYYWGLERAGKSLAFVVLNTKNKELTIMTDRMWHVVFEAQARADVAAYNNRNAQPQQQAQPQVQASTSPTEKNDCLIVATEMFARLSKSAAWARIIGIRLIKNNQDDGGHAVVLYQVTPNDNVFLYDKTDGSIDLGVRSHDVQTLQGRLSVWTRLHDYQAAAGARWVSQESGTASASVTGNAVVSGSVAVTQP